MKKLLINTLLLIFISSLNLIAQDAQSILEEGKMLYRLEKASWYGTDYFLANFASKTDSIQGYLSYESDNRVTNIFYSRFEDNQILARMHFDKTPGKSPVSVDTTNRLATDLEKDLISIRQLTLKEMSNNADDFFSFYENCSFNLIPIITKKERKVYVLTSSQRSDVVYIGNDYLLTFNKKNKLKKKTKIHNSLIGMPVEDEKGNRAISGMHSHVNSKYIDPTDICTILLFKDYTDWKTHYVFGKKHVSIFDIEKETLVILTMKAWNKIMDHQENN